MVNNVREATHLVMKSISRTVKLLCALCCCNYIVSTDWIQASFSQGKFTGKPQIRFLVFSSYGLYRPSNDDFLRLNL